MATNIGNIESFEEGEDFNAWCERFDCFLHLNKITAESECRAAFLTLVGKSSYNLIRDLVSPEVPTAKSYHQLKEILTNHFEPKKNKSAERFKFHRRYQKEGENIAAYVAELKKGAKNCIFGSYLEEALCDQFVVGISSEKIRVKLLAENDLNFKKAVGIACSMEMAELHSRNMQQGIAENCSVYKVKTKCWRCNRSSHKPNDCKFRHLKCFSCGRVGHTRSACRSSSDGVVHQNRKVNAVSDSCVEDDVRLTAAEFSLQDTAELDAGVLQVACINRVSPPPIRLYPVVNNVKICMELDTGAAVSILSANELRRLPGIKIRPCETTLTTYTGGCVAVVGEAEVKVQYGGYCGILPIIVTNSNNVSLFGRDWLTVIQIDWVNISKSIKHVSNSCSLELDHILAKNEEVFGDDLGSFRGVKAKIKLKENTSAKFFKPRSVPYALKEKVTQKLNSMAENRVLEPVNCSEWASPLVIVPKPNNDIRLCADFKVTINKHI
ncbi:uncharacterized protein [Macrobrachium rosenbergii]|uniref:uncharacterized protein n=1 Tax=Macrobrachium rosenbergii TaxID=79674 RepID=UPI0034D41DA8